MNEDKKCPLCRGSMHKTEVTHPQPNHGLLPVYKCDVCWQLVVFVPPEIREIKCEGIIL